MVHKILYVLFGFILLGSTVAIAVPQNASIANAQDLARWVSTPPIFMGVQFNVTTEGGNITNVSVYAADQLTDRWAGFYGWVTAANIVLAASGDTNYLYQWAGNLSDGGEVCVSTDPAFGWSTVQSALDSDIETAWTFGAVLDSAANTYNNSNCALNFTGIPTGNTNTSDWVNHQLDSFYTCVFKDTGSVTVKNDLAFCSPILENTINYNNTYIDYELIVPTNDSPASTETYYFFVELG